MLIWIKGCAAGMGYPLAMHFHLDGVLPPLAAAAAWCGASPGSIPALLFLTGLVGGVAHCGPMCGPFVLAQTAGAPADTPLLLRLAGGLLLPYHLGRLCTYAALGGGAAALGAAAVALMPLRLAVAALLLAAALVFAAQAVVRLVPALPKGWGRRWRDAIAQRWAARLARLSRPLLAEPSPAARFALGIVLGLLPCGLLYGALAAAAATRSPSAGAAAMAAFGLGTTPSLLLVGLGGALCAARWRRLARRAVAPLFLLNAAILTSLALSLASAA